nr:MAG TPA: hypothetical protein [Caudoviricetes sp.]
MQIKTCDNLNRHKSLFLSCSLNKKVLTPLR